MRQIVASEISQPARTRTTSPPPCAAILSPVPVDAIPENSLLRQFATFSRTSGFPRLGKVSTIPRKKHAVIPKTPFPRRLACPAGNVGGPCCRAGRIPGHAPHDRGRRRLGSDGRRAQQPDARRRHAAAPTRRHQRYGSPAEGGPRCQLLRRRRRFQPAGNSRPGRRPPAHQGRRHGPDLRLRQPHERTAFLHRPDPGRQHHGIRRHCTGEFGRRQHRWHHPGRVTRAGIRRGRPSYADQGRGRHLLSQQRQCDGRQSFRDRCRRKAERDLQRLDRAIR